MQMFVANTTQQYIDFIYTVPGRVGRITQRIDPGGQIRIAANRGDLNRMEIDDIINQHRPYGMIEITEIGKTTGLCPLVASVDQMVNVERVIAQFRRNQEVLARRGQEMRRAAAVSIDAKIEEQMMLQGSPDRLRELRVDVEEVQAPRILDPGSRRDGAAMERALADAQPIGEGVIVTRDAPAGEDKAPRRRRRG